MTNVEVNVACPNQRSAGEEQWISVDPTRLSEFEEQCSGCGTDNKPKYKHLDLHPNIQYQAKSPQGRLFLAWLHGRCGRTGKNYSYTLGWGDTREAQPPQNSEVNADLVQ